MRIAGAVALLIMLAAGCDPADDQGADNPEVPVEDGDTATVDVAIVDFAFQPVQVSVAAGGTVTWINDGDVTHTVTANDGSFDSGNIAAGAAFEETFDEAVVVEYACAIHPQMQGSVEVSEG